MKNRKNKYKGANESTDCLENYFKKIFLGFPCGKVVENLSADAGDMGSSPGLGRSHMPRSN